MRRGSLWAADETSPGGRCLVRWRDVCIPRELGGLGISDLQLHGAALRERWQWRKWSDEGRSWQQLILPTDLRAECVFRASTSIIIGDGCKANFWHSHWVDGCRPADLWPNLFDHFNGRPLSLCLAINKDKWMQYVKANPSPVVLRELCQLWEAMQAITFQDDTTDSLRWKWTASGEYTAASAHHILFQGSNDNSVIWRAKAASRAKAFAWILLKGKCLTADNLAKRQIPHDPLRPHASRPRKRPCTSSQTAHSRLGFGRRRRALWDLHVQASRCRQPGVSEIAFEGRWPRCQS